MVSKEQLSQRCCATCVFWATDAGTECCIRFPPVALQSAWAWPRTKATDLCGEHRAAGEESREEFWRRATKRNQERLPDQRGEDG